MLDMVNRSHTAKGRGNPRKALKWILVDSAIIGAIAMAASMPGSAPGLPELWVMFKAFFGAFVLQLAVERGLKKAEDEE